MPVGLQPHQWWQNRTQSKFTQDCRVIGKWMSRGVQVVMPLLLRCQSVNQGG